MKNIFFKLTFILLIGGFITKIIGIITKIIMARMLGGEQLGLYMLIIPTFTLLISLSQFGFPLALAKLIAEDNRNNKQLLISIIPFLMIINIILMIIIILFSDFISNNLLHNQNINLAIKAIAFVIPFTTISSICRSYFFGKGKMIPHVISNIIENITRLLILYFTLPYIIPYGKKYTICYLILINVISEIISTIILIVFIPKNITIKRSDLKPNKSYFKDSLRISIPNTTSRLIASFGYFLEPIIITSILINNYSSSYITNEYGIITGYVIPLITLPSFFTIAISQAILPIISKEYIRENIYKVKKIIILGILLSIIISLPITILFIIYPNLLLQIIYHVQTGSNYLKTFALFSILLYLQAPLSSCLDAMGKSKDNMIITLIGTITRTFILTITSLLNIGMWCLILSSCINTIITTLLLFIRVFFHLNKQNIH